MPEPGSFALFMAAGLALNLTPGPDMLFVATRSAAEGRTAGVVSSLGIAVGSLVHTALLALGLSALLATVPTAYDIVRFVGAGYLMSLGVRALIGGADAGTVVALEPKALGVVFRQGVITNVLNPKVALFFLAFLPQFVNPGRGSPALQILVLGLLFNMSGTLVNIAVALLASRATAWLRGGGRARTLRRASGLVFIGLGMRLAVEGRR